MLYIICIEPPMQIYIWITTILNHTILLFCILMCSVCNLIQKEIIMSIISVYTPRCADYEVSPQHKLNTWNIYLKFVCLEQTKNNAKT